MTARGGGARRALLALLALVVTLLPAAATAATVTAVPAPGEIEIDIVAIGPDVVEPGGTLALTVVVRNTSDEALAAPRVRLKLAPRLLASRSSVARWAERDDDQYSGSVVAETLVPTPIAGGTEVTLPITVAADDLPLRDSPSSWGPRGLAVAVLDAGFSQLALTRSHVVWFPGRSFASPIRTSVLVPITARAPDVDTGLIPAEDLRALTADGGRLASVLSATSVPGVTWALDPAVLASADAAAAGVPGVARWLESLRAEADRRDVVALGYGDPDVTALAHAGLPGVHDLTEEQGRDTADALLDAPTRSDIAWPASGSVDAETLAMLADGGRSAVVLSRGSQPLDETLSFTPTGRATLTVGSGSVDSLLVDTPLSETLASVEDDVLAVQRLLAETAAITMERPSVDRHVLVTATRDWDPDPQVGAAAIRALTAVPWVEALPLSEMLATEPPDLERAPLSYPESDAALELDAATLRAAGGAVQDVREMAPALEDPAELVADAERSAAAAASVAWRDDRDEWTAQVGAFVERSAALAAGVRVVPGSAINVLSAQADLPLTVTNDLTQAVEVRVTLRSSTPRLVAEDAVPVTVPAGGSERVSVPVRALASGNTEVMVQLRTPAGEPIGEPVSLVVRVRADWENRGTLGLAAVAGVVLVVGLVRTIRRGRRTADTSPSLDAGADR